MSERETLRFGPFVLDGRRRRLEREGEEIPLQPRVFDTLLYLLRHPQRVVSKEELLGALWPGSFVTESVLTRCIKEVRRALGDDARRPRYIRTVSRVGYELIVDPQNIDEPGEATVTIAVLPFAPLLAEGRDEELELGLADNLITRLSGLESVVVRPLAAVRQYSGWERDPLSAGRQQGVSVVADGCLNRTGDRLRVTMRVLQVSDGTALLSETFDEAFSDFFAVQDALCQRITDTLAIRLTGAESKRLAVRPTSSLEAYRHFLVARLVAERHTPEDDRRSIASFQQAVEADPGYALAWAGLADAWDSLGTLETSAGHFESARRCALQALELDPELSPALTCLGKISWEHDWRWHQAEQHFRRAIASGPGAAAAHIAFSDFCSYQRRHQEAIEAAGRAFEIDPASPWVGSLLAQALHMAGLYDEAISQGLRTLKAAPDFAFTHLFVGLSSAMMRRWGDAIRHLEHASELSGRVDFEGARGWAYARAGRREEAMVVLRELEARGEYPLVALAFVHHGLGQDERALDLFERALEHRDWRVLLLYAEPALQPLRLHQRAVEILESLHLPG